MNKITGYQVGYQLLLFYLCQYQIVCSNISHYINSKWIRYRIQESDTLIKVEYLQRILPVTICILLETFSSAIIITLHLTP